MDKTLYFGESNNRGIFMPTIIEKVENFIEYGRHQIDQILSLDGPDKSPLPLYEYKKLLIAALIDRYSRYSYPRQPPRARYLAFLKAFGNWQAFDRVCLTHLSQLLRKSPEPEFQDLREYVQQQLSLWRDGEVIPISQDPLIGEVGKHWPQGKDYKEPISGVTLEKLTHGSLFYAYRCSLAHELSAPGFTWDVLDRDEPFYISGVENRSGADWNQRWELVYPIEFFTAISRKCLSCFEGYLKYNLIDPYELIRKGEFWINTLNTG